MPKWLKDIQTIGALLAFFAAILFIHYGIERSNQWLFPLYAFAFVSYLWFSTKSELSKSDLFGLVLLIRLALFFGLPTLSDDFFRFLWDGRLWNVGISPYGDMPINLIGNLSEEFQLIYDSLNSKGYYSTYPPFSQLVFALPGWLGIKDVFWSVFILRLVLLSFEIGGIYLLFQLGVKSAKVALYALNPLVILELTGNLHFEGVVIFFLLLSIWFYQNCKWKSGAFGFALGILTKLTPLMFMPVLMRKIGVTKAILSYLIVGVVMVILFLPFGDWELLLGMGQGLDLFFRKFEFNAGLFFLIRSIGFWIRGYDIVQVAGPWLTLMAFLLIMTYSLIIVKKEKNWSEAFVVILFIQLIFATTVHPWYIIPLIAFGTLSRYKFPIIWSGLIFLSYLGYAENGYEHPMFWIAIEYLIVVPFALYELVTKKSDLKNV